MATAPTRLIERFAREQHLHGLTQPSLNAVMERRPGYSVEKARRFLAFQQRIHAELLSHRILRDNRYTAWFRLGEQNLRQIRAFLIQFSVFSNQFLVAQLQKTINADSLEGMRASKEILANEIGVVFRSPRRSRTRTGEDAQVDPRCVSTEGSVEGGAFHFRAAHFEWLLRIARATELGFEDIGKRHQGSVATLRFCDELIRLYGSEDYLVSQAASYAVENWAAAGFWDELVEGFERYNARTGSALPLDFFRWHSRLEAQHALHTQEELEELYFTRTLGHDAFLRHGNEMLDGVAVFWEGLDAQRRELE
jgi:hypothetical protein